MTPKLEGLSISQKSLKKVDSQSSNFSGHLHEIMSLQEALK